MYNDSIEQDLHLFNNNSNNISKIELKDSIHEEKEKILIYQNDKNGQDKIGQDNFSTNENTNRTLQDNLES
jgi:hypothetical protein